MSHQRARRIAIQKVAKDERVPAARRGVRDTQLNIFNDSILGGPGAARAKRVWAIAAVLLLIVLAWTSCYTVQAESEGVVLRFGKFLKTVEPGLPIKPRTRCRLFTWTAGAVAWSDW